MLFHRFILALGILMLVSCTPAVIDRSETVPEVPGEPVELPQPQPSSEHILTPWITLWQEVIPDLSPDSFWFHKELPLEFSDHGSIEENDLESRGITPSTDSSKTIVIGFNGMSVYWDHQPEGYGPDGDVMLIDRDAGTYQRLLFCGTPCGYDHAYWADDSTVFVTGATEYYPEGEQRCTVDTICTVVPMYVEIDLQNQTAKQFVGSEIPVDEFNTWVRP